jgi:DNA repair protein RadC
MESIVLSKPTISKKEKKATYLLPMAKWPVDDLPRQKLIANGPTSLSDSELLAVVLNTGYGHKSAMNLAQEILAKASYNLSEVGRLNVNQLKKIEGIGDAKAAILVAVMELSRRKQAGFILPRKTIKSIQDVALYLKPLLGDQTYESFHVLYLDNSSKMLKCSCVGKGGITNAPVDIRIILREALELGATQIILCHNHPSGNLKPSAADVSITEKIKKAAKLMDLNVLDHIIVSKVGFCSVEAEAC